MEKYNSPCSLDLILGKENLYKNSPINIGSISLGCCKCHEEQQDTPATTPAATDELKDFIGIPQPWPLADAPEGWLKCNGQTFDTAKYPQLAKLYPEGTLPDLRGEFIRGWDDGRGVDAKREIGSAQLGTHITGDNGLYPAVQGIGKIAECHVDSPDATPRSLYWIAAPNNELQTGPTFWGATRPRNIAFSYIVKAG
ncbi:phage tail protein [Dickeya dianthicola]|uniref:Phage tail protein n=1 Tax=Dickeya dianthicola TaxID=204039 RepID=A0ABX9NI95_9GAMM|nr:phage tail protein [Dickeya dianthicola]ATO33452.1 Phage tail fiber protein [Dickeya dianthicola RNS04.9]MBT1428403.1 tail fiber protein [Dickeya dianthicola]MBT1432473.1 tail fiber protein [Dickeya dianthicola]MBT1459921.1 tail fiber protein [Dickeya dianthicola]MBT1489119.1 tail fiber protein [Dickeya dianthicola]